jgi:hypothetical protein
MGKSPSQLNADIAHALAGTNFDGLVERIEKAIDDHPELTRKPHDGRGVETAELAFSDGDWTARCRCRNRLAKGRGSKLMTKITGHGETPEDAADDLVEKLPIMAEALK